VVGEEDGVLHLEHLDIGRSSTFPREGSGSGQGVLAQAMQQRGVTGECFEVVC